MHTSNHQHEGHQRHLLQIQNAVLIKIRISGSGMCGAAFEQVPRWELLADTRSGPGREGPVRQGERVSKTVLTTKATKAGLERQRGWDHACPARRSTDVCAERVGGHACPREPPPNLPVTILQKNPSLHWEVDELFFYLFIYFCCCCCCFYPLFFRFPSHLGHHRALSRVPCALQ